MFDRLKSWAAATAPDVHALYLAGGDARVPWPARKVAAVAASYALAPVRLFPDYIPLLGRLDDLVIVPLLIRTAVRMMPADLMTEHHAAAARAIVQPESTGGATLIIAVWSLLTILVCWLAYREFKK